MKQRAWASQSNPCFLHCLSAARVLLLRHPLSPVVLVSGHSFQVLSEDSNDKSPPLWSLHLVGENGSAGACFYWAKSSRHRGPRGIPGPFNTSRRGPSMWPLCLWSLDSDLLKTPFFPWKPLIFPGKCVNVPLIMSPRGFGDILSSLATELLVLSAASYLWKAEAGLLIFSSLSAQPQRG